MIFGPSVMCLMALLVLAQSAAVEKQPPFQSSNHGGSHAPIKVAKRQELVEQEEVANAEEVEVKENVTEAPPPKDLTNKNDEPTEGTPAGVAFDGGVQSGGNHVCMPCRCPNP